MGNLKVLRIGVIQAGRIIEERRLKRRETVSIGSGERATFRVESDQIPQSFDLFEHDGGVYRLRVAEKMTGRIQLADAVLDLLPGTLEGRGDVTRRGGVLALELGADARGKVVLGDVTVLFQFVDAPSVQAAERLPSDIRRSFGFTADIQFASLFVLTAVLTTSIAAYARNVPYVEPTLEDIDDGYRRWITPEPFPEPLMDAGATAPKAPAAGPKKPDPVAKKPGGGAAGPKRVGPPGPTTREMLAEAGVVGVVGRGGGAIHDLFAGGLDEKSISEALTGARGIAEADGSERRGTRTGAGGSGDRVSISDLASDTSGAGGVGAGDKQEREAPGGDVVVDVPTVEGPGLTQEVIEREMKAKVRGLKSCYDAELKRVPTLAGKLLLNIEIGAGGRVTMVDIPEDSMGSAKVADCVADRAKRWRFPEPSNGSVVNVAFPLVFTASN